MALMLLVLLLIVIAFGVCVTAEIADGRRRAMKKCMDARTPCALSDIYLRGRYDEHLSYDDFVSLWARLAAIFEIDPERLRPTDTIGSLVPRVPFGLGETVQDDLFELLECDMCDFMAIRSIDDVVRIAAHERRRRIV